MIPPKPAGKLRLGPRTARLLCAAVAVSVIAVLFVSPVALAAAPGVFVVNSTGDGPDAGGANRNGVCAAADGTCTLRAALMEASAYVGHATINFELPGTGVSAITFLTRPPAISNPAGITLDGYSQPGSSPNTLQFGSNARLLVEVRGQGTAAFDGLRFTTSNNVIRGLAIYDMRTPMIFSGPDANDNAVVGNFVCTDAAGVVRAPAVNGGGFGILLTDGPKRNVIGTPALADRNIISGCAHRGVNLSFAGTAFNKVQNNVVGLNPSGSAALPNFSHGIDVNYAAQDNLIGGGSGAGNIVSGNEQEGIEVSHGNANRRNNVIGNFVGTDITGTTVYPYTGNGMVGLRLEGEKDCDPCPPNAGYAEFANNVVVNNAGGGLLIDKGQQHNNVHDNLIGVLPDGTPAGNASYGVRIEHGAIYNKVGPNNVIAHNEAGIQILPTASNPPSSFVYTTHFNEITRNSILDNGGLGIDLLPLNRPNVNGVGSADVMDNIQAPKITGLTPTSVSGTACASCRVEVYLADVSTVSAAFSLKNYGQGKTYLGSVDADAEGNFALTLTHPLIAGAVVTANAIDALTNTSEFAKNVVAGGPGAPPMVDAPPFVSTSNVGAVPVSGTADSDAVQARAVLTDQNAVSAEATGSLDESGSFVVTVDATALAEGPLNLAVTLVDDSGQRSPATTRNLTKDVTAPVLSTSVPAADATVGPPATVSVTFSESLAGPPTITITDGVSPVAGTSEPSSDSRTATFTPAAPLPSGTYTVSASVVDAAGNPGTGAFGYTVDGTAPGAPTVVVPGTINGAGQTAVPVSGTAEAGVLVGVTAAAGPMTATAEATADGAGAYSTTLDLSLFPDGSIEVTAIAQDTLGNSSAPTTTTVTKQSTGPALTGSSPAEGSMVLPPSTVSVTFDQPLANTSSLDLEQGSTPVAGDSAVNGSAVTFTPAAALPSGVYSATASAVDSAGNLTTVRVNFTVDASAPPQPTVTVPSTVSFANQNAVVVSGAAEAGAMVRAAVADGLQTVDQVQTATGGGTYSFSFDVSTLRDGLLSASVVATDALGNVSPAGSATTTKKTLADAPPVSSALSGATSLTLVWAAPADNGGSTVDGYRLTVAPPNGPPTSYTTTAIQYTVSGLAEGTSFVVTVAAHTAAGYGPESPTRTIVTKFRTKVTITPSALTVPAGGSLTLSGVATRAANGAPLPAVNMIVWAINSDNQVIRIERKIKTNSVGQWTYTFSPTFTAKYYATYAGDSVQATGRSPNTKVVTVP